MQSIKEMNHDENEKFYDDGDTGPSSYPNYGSPGRNSGGHTGENSEHRNLPHASSKNLLPQNQGMHENLDNQQNLTLEDPAHLSMSGHAAQPISIMVHGTDQR